MIEESSYLYCKQHGLDIDFDDFIENYYLPSGEGSVIKFKS